MGGRRVLSEHHYTAWIHFMTKEKHKGQSVLCAMMLYRRTENTTKTELK